MAANCSTRSIYFLYTNVSSSDCFTNILIFSLSRTQKFLHLCKCASAQIAKQSLGASQSRAWKEDSAAPQCKCQAWIKEEGDGKSLCCHKPAQHIYTVERKYDFIC